MAGKRALDTLDVALLRALRENPRAGLQEVARVLGVARATATARLQRLEQAGVITGYRVEIDPAALGRPVAAFARIRPTPGQLPKIADLAKRSPEVSECHRITGEDCFLIKLHAPTIEALEEILDRFLVHGNTVTSIVVSSPVPPRPLPV